MKVKTRDMVLSAIFAALIFICTYLIKVPIGNGYVHLGDGFIFITAAFIPLHYAAAAAAVGAGLADLLAGYAAYIPVTVITKALMALAMGLCVKNNGFILRLRGDKSRRGGFVMLIAGLLAGCAVNVGGYFAGEIFMYGFAGAAAALIPNCIQSASGVIVFTVFAPVAAKAMQVFDKNS